MITGRLANTVVSESAISNKNHQSLTRKSWYRKRVPIEEGEGKIELVQPRRVARPGRTVSMASDQPVPGKSEYRKLSSKKMSEDRKEIERGK